MPFVKGKSGNPNGRPKGQTAREALRRELLKPSKTKPGITTMQEWAELIVNDATTSYMKMDVFKFLEGASPADKGQSADDLEDPESTDADGNSVEP